MTRSLWKLWLVTTCAWSLFAVNLVVPAFKNGVFLAHLVNPKYQAEIINVPSNWGLNLLRSMQAILHPSELIGGLQLPFACEEADLQKSDPCWGTAEETRTRLIRRSTDADNADTVSQDTRDILTDQSLVEQQYRAFDKWQLEVPAYTQVGILVSVIAVCLREPLVTLFAGVIAFSLVRRRAPSEMQPPIAR